MENASLQHPYIPNTIADRQEMLKAIGVSSVRELFQDIPEGYRQPSLNIPPALSELELVQELQALAAENSHAFQGPCFLGRQGLIVTSYRQLYRPLSAVENSSRRIPPISRR